MNLQARGCSVILVLALAGCASVPEKEGLQVVSASTESFILRSPLTYPVESWGIVATVPAGTYRLEKENALGRYFHGEQLLLQWTLPTGVAVARGGVWVPRDPAAAPRLYFYSQTVSKGKSLQEALGAPSGDGPATPNVASAGGNSPAPVSPVAAGLGGAIGFAIIGAIQQGEFHLFPASSDPAFATTVQSTRAAP
ncbi:MAG: hypothetical protein EOO30_18120 [Comamonadaceae bacterium]|nr:MAG: hypothetical protein EOO30_18120 [Comamonadaceae bacterium]